MAAEPPGLGESPRRPGKPGTSPSGLVRNPNVAQSPFNTRARTRADGPRRTISPVCSLCPVLPHPAQRDVNKRIDHQCSRKPNLWGNTGSDSGKLHLITCRIAPSRAPEMCSHLYGFIGIFFIIISVSIFRYGNRVTTQLSSTQADVYACVIYSEYGILSFP